MHVSDTHLGYRQYGLSERLNDWSSATRECIDYAIHNRVDCVVHSGDLFNSNKVDHTSLIHAIEMLRALKDADIPFFVIDGNHDRRKGSQTHTALDVLQRLDLCHYLAPAGRTLEGAIGQVNGTWIVGLGYHGAYLRSKLRDFYEQMPEGHNVVLLHAGITQYAEGGHPEIAPPELAVLRPKTAYLALGHYHNKFRLDDWIFNPGSPEYYRFSDYGIGRCFYDVTMQNGSPEVREIDVRGVRRMVSISADHPGDDYSLRGVVQALLNEAELEAPVSGSLLRLILNGEAQTPPNLSELKQFIDERYVPLYSTVLDNTVSTDGGLIEAPGSLDDLEMNMFASSFARYNEQARDVAGFARTLLREIIESQLANTDDAEPIVQHVSRFRRDHV
ncbi:MAG: metallophosphoesterase [Halobacteriota archaeon]